jgi:hypothetical protein
MLLQALPVTIVCAVLADRPAFADPNIVGVWSVVDTILSGCPTGDPVRTVVDMNMFLKEGVMIETPGTPGVGQPPLQRGVPGMGTWAHESKQHFTESFRFFRYNGEDDTFAGTQFVHKDIELSKDGDSFTTVGTTDIYDAENNFITTRCTTGVATRIQ